MLIVSHVFRTRARAKDTGRAKSERVQVRLNELITEGEHLLERSLELETIEFDALVWFRTALSFLKVVEHDHTVADYTHDILSQLHGTGFDQMLGVQEAVGHLKNIAACLEVGGNEQAASSRLIAVAA